MCILYACVCMCGISCVHVYTIHVMTLYLHVDDPLPNAALISSSSQPRTFISNNELAFSLSEEHFGISRLLKPKEMKKPDKLTLLSYLSLFYELFLDMEPHLMWVWTALTTQRICSSCLRQWRKGKRTWQKGRW